MVNRNLWLSTLIMVPTADSIQEVRMMISNYSAEYGARNDKLDANSFFNNRLGAPKPTFRRNEFGGTVGGPIRKDQTFFFAGYQGVRVRQPKSIISTLPTLAQRQWINTGDFSALGTQIFDPTTLSGGLRLPFSGNLIPATRLDPAVRKITGLIPAPTSTAATHNFIFSPTLAQRTDQFDARLRPRMPAVTAVSGDRCLKIIATSR